jgi:hypothetical protein
MAPARPKYIGERVQTAVNWEKEAQLVKNGSGRGGLRTPTRLPVTLARVEATLAKIILAGSTKDQL